MSSKETRALYLMGLLQLSSRDLEGESTMILEAAEIRRLARIELGQILKEDFLDA